MGLMVVLTRHYPDFGSDNQRVDHVLAKGCQFLVGRRAPRGSQGSFALRFPPFPTRFDISEYSEYSDTRRCGHDLVAPGGMDGEHAE